MSIKEFKNQYRDQIQKLQDQKQKDLEDYKIKLQDLYNQLNFLGEY